MQEEFLTNHSFVIPHFFDSNLQPFIDKHLTQSEFYTKIDTHKAEDIIAKEYAVKRGDMCNKIINFYLNKQDLIEVIKEVVQLEEIQSVNGRIYKFEDDENCFDSWHNDLDKARKRLLGFSINLSSKPYEGGEFILREKKGHF